MASFCKDCSIAIFGEDFKEFAHGEVGLFSQELCEGCGWIWVNWEGRRVDENGKPNWSGRS
jgi:hypothetical protein